jgi:tetratricopeptide (TPR) repeat protein
MTCQRHVVAVLLVLCVGGANAPAAELRRHGSWTAAQTAARASGKFIFAYIYQNGHDACAAMENNTFSNSKVVEALQGYEVLSLNGDARQNRDWCEHYRVGTRYNAQQDKEKTEGETAFAAVPALLFLDANGREYYRTYGFHAPDVFLQLLGQVAKLIDWQCALDQRPQDARLHADLGRLYLEMGRPKQGQPLLEAAVKLDQNNTAGARADAELDLIILSIPDDPVMALRNLVAYQFNRPETTRVLEVRYYMAVAQLAAGREAQAEKILLDFAGIPPFLADDQGLAGLQYGYLVERGDKQIGFWSLDDEGEVKKKVREAGEDPGKCRFTRKAINPDYRNPWTEKADLLLKQLLKEQESRKSQPAAH